MERVYLVVCGATMAYRLPQLILELGELGLEVFTLPTPGAGQVVSPRELARVPGHRLVHSYFDAGMLPRPSPGLVLVAPCTFNSLRKLSMGLADNLPLSLATEAIGRGWPVVIAPSLNEGLWRHPLREPAMGALEAWGVRFVIPEAANDYAMATDHAIVATCREALADQGQSNSPRG